MAIREISFDDLPKFTKEHIEWHIYRAIENNYHTELIDNPEDVREVYDTIIVDEYEVSFTYTEIDEYKTYDNEDGTVEIEFDNTDTFLTIDRVEVYDIEQLLKDNGIPYDKSDRSESIYLSEGEFRISTHKRPMVDGLYEWNYIKEVILDNEVEMYNYLKDIINSGEYFIINEEILAELRKQ